MNSLVTPVKFSDIADIDFFYNPQDVFYQRSVMAKNPGEDGSKTVWEKNTPDSLVDLATRCVLANPSCLFTIGHDGDDDDKIDLMSEASSNVALTSNPSTSSSAGAASSSDLTEVSTSLSSNSGTPNGRMSANRGLSINSSIDQILSYAELPVDDKRSRRFKLHKGLRLPGEISEKLFSTLHEEGLDLEDDFAMAFSDPTVSRIRSVDLSGSSITDRGLKCLLAHKLRVLNIHNCRHLTIDSLEALNRESESLVDLTVGNTCRLFPEYIFTQMDEV